MFLSNRSIKDTGMSACQLYRRIHGGQRQWHSLSGFRMWACKCLDAQKASGCSSGHRDLSGGENKSPTFYEILKLVKKDSLEMASKLTVWPRVPRRFPGLNLVLTAAEMKKNLQRKAIILTRWNANRIRNKALDAFFTESAGQSTRSCLCESPSRFQNNPSNLIQSTSKEREGVQIEGENHFNQEAFGNLSVGLLEARKGSALMLTTGTVDQSLKSEGIPLVKSSQTTWHDRPSSSSVDLADELSPMSLSEDVTISSVSAASVSDSCCESISVDCVDILRSHQTPECTASGMTRQRESEEQNCVVDAAQAISNCINAENEHFHITPESFIASQEAPKEDIKSESSECNASEECPKVNCVVSDKKARFSSEYKHHEVGQIRSGGVKSALPGVTRHITAIKAEGSTGIAPECAQRAQDCSDTCPRGKRLSQEHLTKPKNTRSYVEAFEGRINPLAGTSANAKHTVSQKDAHRVCLTEDVTCCRRPTSCLLSPTGKTTPSPQLHVKPTVRSNRRTIMNAILHRCLVGRVQEALKLEVLQELGSTDGSHFVILLKNGQQYSGLFLLNNEVLTRITGVGPRQITTQMVEHFYKYDSGTKSFVEIELTKHLSTAVDAVALMVSHNRKLT
ncbi:unnamed protein product [Mesocestoides corti]|uniref:CKK domain-containing protein n=1 Tax=Mesocestoides corti TaxID=53468 RepID=A0A158QSI4_MESCO|nr:unnamed protein product [Mesocestoides corti]